MVVRPSSENTKSRNLRGNLFNSPFLQTNPRETFKGYLPELRLSAVGRIPSSSRARIMVPGFARLPKVRNPMLPEYLLSRSTIS